MIKNQNGVSLAGVLIGIGILGVVSVGTLQVIDQQLKGRRTQKFTNEMANFHEEIRAYLSDAEACTASLAGRVQNSTDRNIPEIRDKDERIIINTSTNTGIFDATLMQVSSIRLHSFEVDRTNRDQGEMTLEIAYQPQGAVFGLSGYSETMLIRVQRDGSNNLTNCLSYSKMAAGIWRRTQANSRDIFYSGGNVGIETTAPSVRLDVNGSIKLGNSTTNCNSANAGVLRYNQAAAAMEFCNGSQWLTLGGTPSGAVMAFDRNRCPDGWTRLSGANGRVIVGMGGPHSYRRGATGGNDDTSFRIRTNQLPSHRHRIDKDDVRITRVSNHRHSYQGVDLSSDPICVSGGRSSSCSPLISISLPIPTPSTESTRGGGAHSHSIDRNFHTEETGGGQNIDLDNRQRYIALLYCRKN